MAIGKLTHMMLIAAVWQAALSPSYGQVPSSAQLANPELEKTAAPLKRGANSFAESQAKALLESKGYSQISALVNDSEGIWHGTAMREDRQVEVSVDFQGHVATK